ncbi:MAG: hypothetical protein ABIA76_02015 [Candidatus Diapherotrites archaeon]
MTKNSFIALILVLVFFSACVEFSPETRLECIQLSSFYSNSVPECLTPDKCMSEVNNKFAPETDYLNPNIRWEYEKYLLHLSKQWLYFSNARKNLKEIHDACLNEKNFSVVLGNANELGSNLTALFNEIDSSTKQSLKILSLLEIELKEQDINKAKDTDLFLVYSKVLVNVNHASHPELIESSDSYYGTYVSRMNEFNEFFLLNKFEPVSTEKIFLDELLKDFFPFFKKIIPSKNFLVPFFGEKIFSFIDLFIYQSSLNESLGVMNSLNAQKAVEAVEAFIAPEQHSVAGRFVSLINEANQAEKEFNEGINQKKQDVEENLIQAEALLQEEEFEFINEFNENILEEIMKYASEETVIESGNSMDYSLNEFKEIKLRELNELKNKFNEFKLNESGDNLTWGEKSGQLNKINESASKLLREINYFLNEEKESLSFLCEEKISSISERANSVSETGLNEAAGAVLSQLKYVIARFNSKKSIDEKLLLCPPVINKSIEFENALENEDLFIENTSLEFQKCREEVLELINSNEIMSSFSSSANRLTGQINAVDALSQCSALRESIYSAVMQGNEFLEFKEKQSELEEITSGINKLPDAGSVKKNYFNEKNSFFKPFLEKKNFLNFLKKPSLLNEISSVLEEAKNFFREELIKFIEKNALIESTGENITAGKESEFNARISFNNPSIELNKEVFLEFSLKLTEPEIIHSDNCEIISFNEKLVLKCRSISEGANIIQLKSTAVLIQADESEEMVSIEAEKAVFQKIIEFNAAMQVNSVLVQTRLGQGKKAEEITVLFNKELVEFENNEGNLEFILESAKNKDKAEIFYSVSEPIELNEEILNKTGENTEAIYELKISIQNMLSEKIDSIEFVPETVVNSEIKKAYFNEPYENASISVRQGKINILVKNLLQNEKRILLISLEADESGFYWEGKFRELKELIDSIQGNEKQELAEEANALEQGFAPSKKNIGEFDKINKKAKDVSEKENQEKIKEEEYFSLRIKSEQDLDKQTEELSKTQSREWVLSWRNEVQEMLADADSAKEKGDYDLAKSLLLSAGRKILNPFDAGSIDEVEEKKEELMQKAEELIEKAKAFGLSKNVSSLKEKIYATEKELEEAVKSENSSAFELINELEENTNELEELLSAEIKKKIEKELSKLRELKQKIAELQGKLSELKKMLQDLDELKEVMQYAPPTTLERIEVIEKEIQGMGSVQIVSEINEIILLHEQGLEFEALEKINEFADKYPKETEKINSMHEEVSLALEKIIQDSLTQFNLAANKSSDQETIEKARKAIEEKKYIKAMALSKTALIGLTQNGEISLEFIPLTIIPFILVICGVIGFNYWKKKQEQKPKKKRRIKGIEEKE